MYIGGHWTNASDGSVLQSIDPTTEERIATFPNATAHDVDRAVVAAREAFDDWRMTTPAQRATLLHTWADSLELHADELAEIDTVDVGNPLTAMKDDAVGGCKEIRMFAGMASEMKASSTLNGANQFAYGLLEPYGIVGRIVPFNHPFKFAAGKSSSALVAGNCVILKPSEQASLSAIRLAQLSEGILPAGVFNVVTGDGRRTGAAIAEHPGISRLAFTGSVEAGKAVMRAAAERIKHVSLELGGKNPMIVFPDVDLDKTAAAAIRGMNFARSQGQSCQSTSRVFVNHEIINEFSDRVVAMARDLKVGDPLDEATQMGPIAYKAHYDRVLDYVRLGVDEGANLLTGGRSSLDRGFFIDPVVFGEVSPKMRIAQEEIFGPVMSLIEWSDIDHVIDMANDTDFGLTAAIWTNDVSTAHRLAHSLEAGYVWINGAGRRVPGTPFGGYKLSGLGKESSIEEVLSFCRTKTIAVSI
jgi:betaine-aldehyde dehydrogenase